MSLTACTISSTEYGRGIIRIRADASKRFMWSVRRNTAGPSAVSYARMPSNTPIP